MSQLCFLHGFLGCKEDWEDLSSALSEGTALRYPFEVPENGILVGYSMGGRIALDFPNPKVIISAHLGLTDGHEKRRKEENLWIQRLQTLPFADFLHAWYAQPLFDTLRTHPDFPKIFARRLKVGPEIALQQLLSHRLSDQLQFHPHNTLFLYGEKDLKYKDLYTHFNAIPIERSGHACHLENPTACAKHIRDFVDRVRKLYRHQVP
jgi:pimeloyl-ACP methyl ester carboxylesterase